ncbi:MAG: DUF4056 domain-containing protein, partial [Phycisphaerae bacterium]|nr:DUF4056 domain-containing protein [Phycisphaerae bacterium]
MVGSASGRPGKWQATAVGLVGLSVLLAGCGSARDLACPGFVLPRPASEYDFAPFASEPRARLGGTPYMGYYTLFAMADPDRLGQHSYQGVWTPGETSRGTLYTARAGFIDVAHMRKSIDWTAFHYVRIRTAIDEGWPCIKLPSKEPSVYFLNFKYPAFWDEMGAEERASLAHELAIRLAVELSHVQLTWHE